MKRYSILLVLGLFALTLSAHADSSGVAPSEIYLAALKNYRQQFSPNGQLPDPEEPAVTQPRVPTEESLVLNLAELVSNVVKHNQELQRQKTEWGITQVEEQKNHAIFEPDFISSLKLERNSQKNTIEEALTRQLASTYTERNWDFETSIEGLLKTGAEFNLGYNLRHLSNSVTRSLVNDDEYQMYLGVSLSQPLLKNFGIDATTAAIRSAQAESQVSFQNYRQELMRIVHKAATAYWDYHFAEQKVKLRKESIRIATSVLSDNRQRLRNGKSSELDVYAAQAAVSSRKVLLSEAEQDYIAAANQLRNLLALTTAETPLGVTTGGANSSAGDLPHKQQLVESALRLKPRYLAGKEKLKQSDIRIAYAKNQTWPELDLLASYGLNGLGFSSAESWRQVRNTSYQSWGIGIEFRQPLLGDIAGKSDYKKAELEKKRQLYELKNLEIELVNTIDTALNNVKASGEQIEQAEQVAEIHKKLLAIEMEHQQIGKSDSRRILEKEELLREAKETLLKNQVKYQVAQIALDLAAGRILLKNGVEVMEIR